MAHPSGIESPQALYQVTARDNSRQAIILILDDEDRQQFLNVLARVVSRFHLLLHAVSLGNCPHTSASAS